MIFLWQVKVCGRSGWQRLLNNVMCGSRNFFMVYRTLCLKINTLTKVNIWKRIRAYVRERTSFTNRILPKVKLKKNILNLFLRLEKWSLLNQILAFLLTVFQEKSYTFCSHFRALKHARKALSLSICARLINFATM